MKRKINNQDGFTLIEILIAFVLIGIMAAIGVSVYMHANSTAATGGIVSNIQKFETVADQYASMNSGTYTGMDAQALQSDALLPNGWTVEGGGVEAVPPNTSTVAGYFITTGALGTGNSAYDIGFSGTGNGVTDIMVHSICLDFENKIDAFEYNGGVTTVTTGGTNCNVIPTDNKAITGAFWLGFE